eukprot:jgi/Astpho2/7336/fgenesh1_pg.00114_%23_2_t
MTMKVLAVLAMATVLLASLPGATARSLQQSISRASFSGPSGEASTSGSFNGLTGNQTVTTPGGGSAQTVLPPGAGASPTPTPVAIPRPTPTPTNTLCPDIPPPGTSFTCAQQKGFGKCNAGEWNVCSAAAAALVTGMA